MKPEQVAFDTQLEDMRNDYQDAMQGGSGASGLASAYADRALYRIAFLPSALEAASRKISLAELDSFAKAAFVDASGVALALGNLNRSVAREITTSTLELVRKGGRTMALKQGPTRRAQVTLPLPHCPYR